MEDWQKGRGKGDSIYVDYFFYYVYECISNNVMLHNFFFCCKEDLLFASLLHQ